MSSSPKTPPETPFKKPSPVENLSSRIPLPTGRVDGISEYRSTPRQDVDADRGRASESPRQADDEVQVPSSPQVPEFVPHAPASQSSEETRTDDENLDPQDGADGADEDMDAPLPLFDWDNVRNQYTKSVQDVISEEEELLEQFTKYTQLFVSWAESAAERDNNKASKRLKTRERHVRLQEQSLEEKKQHYASVVDAFQKALDLLGR